MLNKKEIENAEILNTDTYSSTHTFERMNVIFLSVKNLVKKIHKIDFSFVFVSNLIK